MFTQGRFYVLCAVIMLVDFNTADWVDLPQFSDKNKIYRILPAQYDQLHKFRRGNTDVVFHFSDDRNGSQSHRRLVKIAHAANDKKTEIKESGSATVSRQLSNVFRDRISDDSSETSKNRTTINDNAATENLLSEYGISTTTTTTTTATILKTLATQPSSTTTHKQNITRDEYCNDTLKQDDTIFQYLPVDILKSVHNTLQSQPISFEGKLHFLRMFEKTLMSEIESRLAAAMSPRRKTRGTEYYGHGYDDHDEHSVGFPSIEGALMAISFLTFAVYLVRLVMLLFRNMNNPMTTTTAATVFLGKRKRSVDLDDDTARILNNINAFVPDL